MIFSHVHRNRHNILLDQSLIPYLADFGFFMALPIEHKSSCLVTALGSITFAGTQGYLAPEFTFGKLGPKTDVYSYGVVKPGVFLFSHVKFCYCRCAWRHTQAFWHSRTLEKKKIW